jgi:hypothetical protein
MEKLSMPPPDPDLPKTTSSRQSEAFRLGTAEVSPLKISSEGEVGDFRKDPRGFLRTKGIPIGESEPIILQEPCRDPNNRELPNVLVVRKTCSLPGSPKISIVLVI